MESTRFFALIGVLGLVAAAAGCSSGGSGPSGAGGNAGSGGATGTGSTTGRGGASGTGSGGSANAGGAGSGGTTGPGTAGTSGTGSGGNANAGASGAGSGGTTGPGTAGMSGTGVGGTQAGGRGGSGGTTGPGTAGTSGTGVGGTQAGGRGGSGGTTSGTAGISGTAGASSTGGASGGGGTCTPPRDVGGAGGGSCTPPTPPSAKDSVTLDMAVAQGAPTYSGSGFIYGISEDGVQPPTALLRDIKVQGFRAGRGASGGCGQAAWDTHWKTIKGYYARAKEMGVPMLILVSDDYQYSCPLPGDGGDWTTFTGFIGQLIDNVKANGMTGPDVRWELWNEADYSPTFWTGTQAQWLDTWKHAYQQIRAAIPGAIIEGPSLATGPGGSWMNAFLDYAKTNNVIPDYISWHEAGGGGDPVNDAATITRALSTRGITGVKGFDLNEYGSKAEQNPGHSAWFLARFDRAGIQGMRSNWGGATFFSNMGDLVTTNWQPNSQYWIYKRYADQTGLRTSVTAGTQVEAVAYQDACAAKSIIVVGNKGGATGSVNVVIHNVPGWLQSGGSTKVLVENMPTGTAALSAPVVVSNAAAAVTCNALTVTINWATATDGYVVTLSPP